MKRRSHGFTKFLLSAALAAVMASVPAFVPAGMAFAATTSKTAGNTGTTAKTTTTTTNTAANTNFKDISRHWARTYIEKAVKLGIVSGYSDGTFKPDRAVTRAEFARMLNIAIGNNNTAAAGFSDVDAKDWYYSDVCKGVAAAYISGYDDGSFKPNNTITRQEAAVILARIVPAYGSEKSITGFSDYRDVGSWASGAMRKITGKGYISGSDNKLTPRASLTRGQAVKIIVDVVEGENIIKNNQTIIKDGITIRNTIYANQISVGTAVNDGTANFDNCTVLGNINVLGGGSDSGTGVILRNTRAAKVTVARGDATVRVQTRGESTAVNTVIDESGILQEEKVTQNGDFGRGFVNVFMNRKSDLELNADVDLLELDDNKCDATIKEGASVESINAAKNASRSDITLESGAAADTVDIYAESTAIHGKGSIRDLNVHANGLTYETEPGRLNVDASVEVKPVHNIDPSAALTITAAPEDGATDVSVTGTVELKFSSAVHVTGSTASRLTDTQADSLILLKKDDPAGQIIPCSVTVNNNGQGVTLKPQGTLAHGTTYYVRIGSGDLTDAYGNTNPLYLTSFTTTGTKQSSAAELNSLEIGCGDSSGTADKYSTMSVAQDANNRYYIGTDKRTVSVKLSTLIPDPTAEVTLNNEKRTLAESEGIASFDIPAGTGDPGEIKITLNSANGDYAERTYSIKLVRITPEIKSAEIQGRGDELTLDLLDSLSSAEASNGNSISFADISGSTAELTVDLAETANSNGITLKVEKYDKADDKWTEVQASGSRWILGNEEAFGDAGGIYRITSASKVCGSTQVNGSETETSVKYVNVAFTA